MRMRRDVLEGAVAPFCCLLLRGVVEKRPMREEEGRLGLSSVSRGAWACALSRAASGTKVPAIEQFDNWRGPRLIQTCDRLFRTAESLSDLRPHTAPHSDDEGCEKFERFRKQISPTLHIRHTAGKAGALGT